MDPNTSNNTIDGVCYIIEYRVAINGDYEIYYFLPPTPSTQYCGAPPKFSSYHLHKTHKYTKHIGFLRFRPQAYRAEWGLGAIRMINLALFYYAFKELFDTLFGVVTFARN